ncbi:MAG: sigma-54 dependent transcriptional regulator [Gammaproteobacteria bacterium]|nr:sigma-54 dependent transcriptional regulator [Gammaproteobacteria bacterium]
MPKKHLALIVDDEPDICELLELTLNRMDIDTLSAGDLQTAYKLLNENKISICLTDMRLPDGNGIELVKIIQKKHAHIPVAMISAHGNMDTAIEALKSGAFDFVSKPLELAELRNLVNSAIKLADKNQTGSATTPTNEIFEETSAAETLLGSSPAMQKAIQLIKKLSKSQAPIYISGESGTGKELAARQIHQLGARSDGPFIPVNCGAIPGELMESEFFGHIKGSFSGATKDKKGLFQAANQGTLFLDEVADLPLSMQVKLLRAIQEKSIRSVGALSEEKIDLRIISATHKDLAKLVKAGDFRQDLFYRINVIELPMPSLKEHREDIQQLAEYFITQISSEKIELDSQALSSLEQYSFPGNVRELENILERAIALCDNNIITVEDLGLSTNASKETPDDKNFFNKQPYSHPLQDKEHIIKALEQTRWNQKAAAELLGVTYRQLRYRLQKLGIDKN